MNADRSGPVSRSQERADGSRSDRLPDGGRITPGEPGGMSGGRVRRGNGDGQARVTPRNTDPVWQPRSN